SRVRSETGLATGAASAPSAAVAVAARIFTRLAGRSALILGAGDMAELAATCLVSEGVRVTLVANRTYERARAIAEQLGARALTLDEAWEHFADADIVLSSTAAPHAVVTWDRVAPAVARRRGRPLCILDLGMPRDVEPLGRPARERLPVRHRRSPGGGGTGGGRAARRHSGGGAHRERGSRALLGLVRRTGRRARPEGVPRAVGPGARRRAGAHAAPPRAFEPGRPRRNRALQPCAAQQVPAPADHRPQRGRASRAGVRDRKSTRLNSSH